MEQRRKKKDKQQKAAQKTIDAEAKAREQEELKLEQEIAAAERETRAADDAEQEAQRAFEARKLHQQERLQQLQAAAVKKRAAAARIAKQQADLTAEGATAEERLAASLDAHAPPPETRAQQPPLALTYTQPSSSHHPPADLRLAMQPSRSHSPTHMRTSDVETPPSVEQMVKKVRRLEGEQKVCRQEWREGEIEEIKYDLERRRTRMKRTGSWR